MLHHLIYTLCYLQGELVGELAYLVSTLDEGKVYQTFPAIFKQLSCPQERQKKMKTHLPR